MSMNMPVTGPVEHLWLPGAGVRLHALAFGDPDSAAPPVLLLHGVTGHAWLWHDVARWLAATRRVIALDMRGHGDSQWAGDQAYGSEHHIADLAALADGLGLDRLAIAGLSWGALVGIGYAAAHPQRVERLAIVDVEASFALGEDAVAPRPASFDAMADVLAWERQANPHAPDALLGLCAQQSVRPCAGGRWERKHDPFFLRCWPFRRDDRWGELGRLRLPTLLLNGAASFVHGEVMRQMAARVAGAEFDVIEHAGHLVPLEAPEALGQRLSRFLDPPAAA